MLERHEGSFIAPQGNLANEVSEIQTCLGRGLDKEPDKAGCDLVKDRKRRPEGGGVNESHSNFFEGT
jgi:hypothetical protein